MSGWKEVTLRDVCETRTGGTPSRTTAKYWSDGSIPWIKSGELRDGPISSSQEKISACAIRDSSASVFSAGTVLMALYGATAARLGTLAIDAATNQAICGFFPSEQLFPRFLYLSLLANRSFLIGQAMGGAQPNISQKIVGDLRITLPPLPEQKRIAEELDRRLALIAEAREAAERRLAAAELLETALFREVFGGATPVSIGAPMEKGASGPFAKPEPFPHPPQRAWKDPSPYRRLSEVARLESGHTPSRKKPEWWGGDIPWIALPDIRALDGRIAMETIRNTNPKGIANSSARILPKDTVVFGRDVQVGFTTILGRPMATSQHFFNWICGDGLNPRYLMHALRASKPYLESMSSGAIHKTIYMPAARDFHLLLPDRNTQDALAADLDTRLAHTATILQSARAELEAIKALPAAALREVFR